MEEEPVQAVWKCKCACVLVHECLRIFSVAIIKFLKIGYFIKQRGLFS